MTKKLHIPFVAGLSAMDSRDIERIIEKSGSRAFISEVNWPQAYPYAPLCAAQIARDEKALIIHFHYYGMDKRAMNVADNGRQWEDSCCEFFVKDPKWDIYYNFEINCFGKILAAAGPDRHNRAVRSIEEMEQIRRITVYEDEELDIQSFDIRDMVRSWDVTVCIPYSLIGVDAANLPAKLCANFYNCGDMTSNPHFVSWNPIDTEHPDFHRPEFFGELILKDE